MKPPGLSEGLGPRAGSGVAGSGPCVILSLALRGSWGWGEGV